MSLDRTRIRGMHKDLRALALQLEELGWTAKHLSQGIRFSNPLDLTGHPIFLPNKKTVNSATINTLQHRVSMLVQERERLDREREPERVLADSLSIPEQVIAKRLAKDVTPDEVLRMEASDSPQEVAVEVLKSRSRKEVSRRPFMAARRPGRGSKPGARYESETILEIAYSDGTTGYACAWEGCEFSSDNYRSVSSHYAGTHSKDRRAQVGLTIADETYVEPITTRSYQPTERLVATLGAEIKRALAAGLNAYEISEQLLKWLHDRPDLGPLEDRVRDHAELTSDQILDRIRVLVDTGSMMRLREENDRLVQELASANAHLEREREARRAVAELLLEDSE